MYSFTRIYTYLQLRCTKTPYLMVIIKGKEERNILLLQNVERKGKQRRQPELPREKFSENLISYLTRLCLLMQNPPGQKTRYRQLSYTFGTLMNPFVPPMKAEGFRGTFTLFSEYIMNLDEVLQLKGTFMAAILLTAWIIRFNGSSNKLPWRWSVGWLLLASICINLGQLISFV